MAKTVTKEVWEYEYHPAGQEKAHWISEDDRRTAEYKALHSSGATGRIRSRKIKIKTSKWKVETL